jgi:hypothetical protein
LLFRLETIFYGLILLAKHLRAVIGEQAGARLCVGLFV